MKHVRHLVYDVLGVLLILLSPFLGWIPGPGGIPLFLGGLGFLSVHHDWAKKLLQYVKENGLKLNEFIFRKHPVLEAVYDIASLALFAGGVYLIITYTRNITLSVAIVCIFTGLAVFLGNRKRIDAFSRYVKKLLKR